MSYFSIQLESLAKKKKKSNGYPKSELDTLISIFGVLFDIACQ